MELAASRALANRLLAKFDAKPGVVTQTSTALNATSPDLTAKVLVRITTREATTTESKINAIITDTPFPVEGCSLRVDGKTYDIVSVEQSGVDAFVITQKVVLHGR